MMKHFSHEHPLFLRHEERKSNDDSDTKITCCNGCSTPLTGPFYGCGDCVYFLHKKCAELPMEMKHPMHPEHILTLLVRSPYPGGEFWCDLCNENWSQAFVYNCSTCGFDLDMICASGSHIMFGSHTMKHFSHKHPLFLRREESKVNDGSDTEISSCNGCSTPLTGPFYGCGECPYNLHKTCAELPMKMNHPMHPEHPLTLHLKPPYQDGLFICNLCIEIWSKTFVYNCSTCGFVVDMICASASHTIVDKCHPHPLTPSQVSIAFPCHICRTKEDGVSYKCNTCLFWVHQNCTLLEDTVVHGDHEHPLTLLPSIPFKYIRYSVLCDMCYDKLFFFGCSYSCEGCLFFAHVNCATSGSNQDVQPDSQRLLSLPIQQESTDLISQFVQNYIDLDANIENKINHFNHNHPLFLVGEQDGKDKICDACALPISTPSYDCRECGYYLHKWCAELPKSIQHPSHPAHKLSLQGAFSIFCCESCYQWCNGFGYKCLQCEEEGFKIDIKCASVLGKGPPIYHEAHKHPLVPKFSSSIYCSACRYNTASQCTLRCETCSFNLCFMCAMMPAIVNHRYDTHPFVLTYSPPGSDYDDYICELCEEELNPKYWHYNCRLCDRFIHIDCMRLAGAGSCIKYGKEYWIENYHEHDVTLISCTNNYSPCSDCRNPLVFGNSGLGFECVTCNCRTHYMCPI